MKSARFLSQLVLITSILRFPAGSLHSCQGTIHLDTFQVGALKVQKFLNLHSTPGKFSKPTAMWCKYCIIQRKASLSSGFLLVLLTLNSAQNQRPNGVEFCIRAQGEVLPSVLVNLQEHKRFRYKGVIYKHILVVNVLVLN